MKPTIIGHNWFFPSLSLWLSYNWLWTPSNGELIDSGLNSSLFNNYAAIGRAEENRRPPLPPPPPPLPFFVCYERNHFCCPLQSVPNDSSRVAEREGCSWMKNVPQRGTWRCEIADSSLPSAVCLKRYFFFYWQSGLNVWQPPPPPPRPARPPHPPPALIAFVSRSPPIYCCNFFNFSGLVVWRPKASAAAAPWEMYIKLGWKTIQKKKKRKRKIAECFFLSCLVGIADLVIAPPEATSSNE